MTYEQRKIDRMAQDTAKGVTWHSQSWDELYWSAADQEPRRLHLFQYNAEAEALDFGAAGSWGYAWHGVDGDGFDSEAEARDAALKDAPTRWGGLSPMEA